MTISISFTVNSFEIVSNTAGSALIGHSQTSRDWKRDHTCAKFKVWKPKQHDFALIRYRQKLQLTHLEWVWPAPRQVGNCKEINKTQFRGRLFRYSKLLTWLRGLQVYKFVQVLQQTFARHNMPWVVTCVKTTRSNKGHNSSPRDLFVFANSYPCPM